jgi:hypothetical protein
VHKFLSIAAFWIAEFAILFGVYLLFASSLDRMEIFFGFGIAALAATGTEVVRAQNLAEFRPRLMWLLYALALPWYVLSGAGEIFLVLAKYAVRVDHPRSLHRAVRFEAGAADAISSARRALAITYSTVPPNFIILDILRARNLMLYHQISPSGVPKITEKLGAQP